MTQRDAGPRGRLTQPLEKARIHHTPPADLGRILTRSG
jgi:hypothetical protein